VAVAAFRADGSIDVIIESPRPLTALTAPRLDPIATVFDLPERVRAQLTQFFKAAAFFEKKAVRLLGWDGPDRARAFVEASIVQG